MRNAHPCALAITVVGTAGAPKDQGQQVGTDTYQFAAMYTDSCSTGESSFIYTYTYIYVYIYIYVSVCMQWFIQKTSPLSLRRLVSFAFRLGLAYQTQNLSDIHVHTRMSVHLCP